MIDKLHYISQQCEHGSHLTAIQHALEAGCKWIQLRVKNELNDLILKYAIEANKICKQYTCVCHFFYKYDKYIMLWL